MTRPVLLLPALLALLALPACKPGLVPIGSLLASPARYDGKTVAIVGTVKGQVGVMGWTAYEITDSTGTLTVATKEFGAPLAGVKMGVQGRFHARIAFDEGARPALVEMRRWNAGPRPAPVPAEPESLAGDTT